MLRYVALGCAMFFYVARCWAMLPFVALFLRYVAKSKFLFSQSFNKNDFGLDVFCVWYQLETLDDLSLFYLTQGL